MCIFNMWLRGFHKKKGKQWTMREQMWLDEEEYVFSLPVSCDACGGSRPRGWVTVYTCVSESGICTEQNSLLCLFFFFPFLLQAQFSVTFFDGLWVERVYPQLLCHIDTEPQPRWDRLQQRKRSIFSFASMNRKFGLNQRNHSACCFSVPNCSLEFFSDF